MGVRSRVWRRTCARLSSVQIGVGKDCRRGPFWIRRFRSAHGANNDPYSPVSPVPAFLALTGAGADRWPSVLLRGVFWVLGVGPALGIGHSKSDIFRLTPERVPRRFTGRASRFAG